ncbi:MAG: hypothetical protein P1S60_14645, partial [Anaerolineae bacterium]|nr:hypothetical protein [Anaerolineae bacterium]
NAARLMGWTVQDISSASATISRITSQSTQCAITSMPATSMVGGKTYFLFEIVDMKYAVF